MDKKWAWILAAAVLALSAWVALYHLGSAPFQDYDESTYAQVTREMRQSGDLFLLTHGGNAYFEKPPLYFWLADASESVFSEGEFAMRLPSALSLIALVGAVMLLTYELNEDAWASVLAGAILLTMAPVVDTARQVRMDVLISFFIIIGAYGFARGLKDSRWFYLFGAAVGLAVMTKSVIAVFAFVAAGLIALVWNRWSWLKERHFWLALCVAVLIALPWHLIETAAYGFAFWKEYFGYTVITRSAEDVFAVTITNGDYIWYLSNFAWPWTQLSIACVAGTAVFWRRMRPRARSAALMALLAGISVIAVFFYAKTKAPTYLIPLYPFAAIYISLCLRELYIRVGQYEKIFLALGIAGLLVLGAGSVWYNGFHRNPYYAQTDELAQEEKTIGLGLAAAPAPLYAFQTTTLGSIMFYSHNDHPQSFAGLAPAGSAIVLPSNELAALKELYPNLSTSAIYAGAQLTLLRVS